MNTSTQTFAHFTLALVLGACSGGLSVQDPPPEGAGGSSGSGGSSSGGAQRFAANDPSCPASAPGERELCTISEGTNCLFNDPDASNPGYTAQSVCGCWAAAGGEQRWSCYVSQSSPYECPAAEPASGSSCSGLFGAECSYPERTLCACSSQPGVWACYHQGRTNIPDTPATLDLDVPVNELTLEERQTFCDWFGTSRLGEGYPEDPPAPVNQDGYTYNSSCHFGGSYVVCDAAMPGLSSDQCVANLGFSSCTAPLSELADCVHTIYDGCFPSPRGCAPYLDREGCSGTLVNSRSDELGGSGGTGGTGASGSGAAAAFDVCSIRVE